jgi:acyl-CoA synthetase (AMP-forming)/AMP-acid ligase II
MSVGYYTPYTNGPTPSDRISAGNTKSHFVSGIYTSGSLGLTMGVLWMEYQAIARARGIIFYPDMTELDISTNYSYYKTRVLVQRLAYILGIPFWLS